LADLYRPSEHEPLVDDDAWHADRARDAIAAIVADAEVACDGVSWPVHPKDVEPGDPAVWTTLYLGSAGMCWALASLGTELDVADVLDRAIERWREQPDAGDVPALLMGESGLLLVARMLGASTADDDRLRKCIHANRENPTWELLWGSPGTMLAAHACGFDDLWRESAELLWDQWDPETNLWTQDMYGETTQYLGPGHGAATNIHVLRGRRDDELRARATTLFETRALRHRGLVNWPPTTDSRPEQIRVQWCHGAPGIVTAVGDLLPLDLALGGGELTWTAGPLAKGPGLCHGTAGNGYAFLKLFRLTRDELWLDRARRFAMHAIAQVDDERDRVGHGRFSLFTGDAGVALYLRACLDADARFPTLDHW
jgi:hypothetical protein